MHLKHRVWVPRYALMRFFSDNVPNHAREASIDENLAQGLRRLKGP